jgi:mono/diheme cytochrome c family protein
MSLRKMTVAAAPLAIIIAAAFVSWKTATEYLAGVPDEIDFNWHVRPILSDNCFRCHGPDAKARKVGLRLDLPETAYGELPENKGKHAIVPGKPSSSELIRRITSKDPKERMPPAETHKTLTDAQIALLTAWIERGAPYKPHWAFIAPTNSKVPAAPTGTRIVNEIDNFVLARQRMEGLSSSPEADRETLINRVSLTLTGLPPTLQQIDDFIADIAPNAFEKVVDRLLASPAYGEHMAAGWMNVARWADSDGFLDDHHDRTLWPWRDWVITAFNDNLPYDKFGTEQLAGDLLPSRTKDQILATAFLRVGNRTTENGAIDEEYKIEYSVDRANTVGLAFMGLTVGCARCHDHKYDPIKQKDYYSLTGFFNSTDEPGFYPPGHSGIQAGPTLPWPDAETQRRVAAAENALRTQDAAYRSIKQKTEEALTEQAKVLMAESAELALKVRKSIEEATVAYYPFEATEPIPDSKLPEILRKPEDPPKELVTLDRAKVARNLGVVTGAKLGEKPATPRPPSYIPRNYVRDQMVYMPSGLPGGAPSIVETPELRDGVKGKGLFFNEENKGFLAKDVGYYDRTRDFSIDFWFYVGDQYPHMVPIINHRDEDNSGGAGYRIELEDQKVHFYMAHSRPFNMISLIAKDPLPLKQWTHITMSYDGSSKASGVRFYFNGLPAAMEVTHDNLTQSILPHNYAAVFDTFMGIEFGSRFREKAPVGSGLDEVRVFSRALAPIEVAWLHGGEEALFNSPAASDVAVRAFLAVEMPEVIAAKQALIAARDVQNKLVSLVPQVLVMGDSPVSRPTYRLERGVYNERREQVLVKALDSVLPWDDSLPPNRIGLAKWLFDKRNPLTARVFVNRVWQSHFGQGLVETSEDFGAQGSIPSNPELLDWLAVHFEESGWNIKALNKLIVMSATYRQSSNAAPQIIEKDPRNVYLTRGIRQRMPAEMVRDNALAAAGLLVPAVGGPSVHPYQPQSIWNPLNSFYEYPEYTDVPPDEHHRRSLYTFVKRSAPHPGMQIFDFADRTASSARRRVSNTPLQALELMNDPQFIEAYRVLASHSLEQNADTDAEITMIFRLARRQRPTLEQLAVLKQYYAGELAHFRADPASADSLLKVGVTPAKQGDDPIRLAALTNVTSVIMNSPDAYSLR